MKRAYMPRNLYFIYFLTLLNIMHSIHFRNPLIVFDLKIVCKAFYIVKNL